MSKKTKKVKKRDRKLESELAKKARQDAGFEALAGTDDPPNDDTVLGDDPYCPSSADLPAKSDSECCDTQEKIFTAVSNESHSNCLHRRNYFTCRIELRPGRKARLVFYQTRDCSGEPNLKIKLKRRQLKILSTIIS